MNTDDLGLVHEDAPQSCKVQGHEPKPYFNEFGEAVGLRCSRCRMRMRSEDEQWRRLV